MRIPQRLERMPSLASLPDDFLLTIEETAAYLGISPSTLEKWRLGFRGTNGGPPWIPLHDGPKSPVRYMISDVRTWLTERRTVPTERGQTPARAA